jgi:hypothetical protein
LRLEIQESAGLIKIVNLIVEFSNSLQSSSKHPLLWLLVISYYSSCHVCPPKLYLQQLLSTLHQSTIILLARREIKTQHSRRRVAMTPKLAAYLRGYQAERQGLYLVLGQPLTLDSLVFAHLDGRPFDPSVLSHAFGKIAARADLKGLRFHDLRHTFASLMLLRGAKPKVISEALGHSSVAFTMDTYSHIIEGMQEDAMALLDEVLPAGVAQKINAKLTPTV